MLSGLWWPLVAQESQAQVAPGGLWWPLVALESQAQVAPGGLWWPLVASGGPLEQGGCGIKRIWMFTGMAMKAA